ncbi:hypothetical protein EDD18DRAFT_1211642 [Armillaria luteobubalina]|uniref:Uncharacterized protein n=1 Tax=Armillaria luteobubalina TaxID=153913 RepID=A0AA39P593_9AGAR|nr:hypothetical protein EDD18DRAFT_1211642 [Armillaria luteobubalina]
MKQLPQELIDAIVDGTQDESGNRRKTLLSCSLTSRAFLPRTRKYLFHTVSFGTGKHFRDFHQICQMSLVDIPRLVKYLCVGNERIEDLYSDEILPYAVASFTNMKSIHLRRLDWDDINDATHRALGAHTFESISFDSCSFRSSALLCAFFSGSSSTLRKHSFSRSEMLFDDHESFLGPRPEIEELIFYEDGAEVFDVKLLPSKSFSPVILSSLQVLEVCINTQEHMDSIQMFLDSITTRLDRLEVFHVKRDFSGPINTDWLDTSLILDNVVSLSITLDDCLRPEYSDANFLSWWIENINSHGSESKFECILLRVRPNSSLAFPPFYEEDIWEDLAQALAAAKVKTLGAVVYPTHAQDDDASYARGQISRNQWAAWYYRIESWVGIASFDSQGRMYKDSHGQLGPFASYS